MFLDRVVAIDKDAKEAVSDQLRIKEMGERRAQLMELAKQNKLTEYQGLIEHKEFEFKLDMLKDLCLEWEDDNTDSIIHKAEAFHILLTKVVQNENERMDYFKK